MGEGHFQGISNNSTCGESRASSAARRFFVGPLAGANQKTARIVDPMRRFFVTISEQSSGGKDSVDSLCGEFLEMPYIFGASLTATQVLTSDSLP